MVEIRVQQRQRRTWWPWLLLIVLPLLWLLFRPSGRADLGGSEISPDSVFTPPTAIGGAPSTDALAIYSAFIKDGDVERSADAQHRYTAEGLRRLAAALEAQRAASATAPHLAGVRAAAESLASMPEATARDVDVVREGFGATARAVRELGAPNDKARAVQAAARAVSPRRPLVTQRTAIQRFFESARDALETGAPRNGGDA